MFNAKKLGIICLIVLLALGALGVSYGAWTQNLNMNASSVSVSSLSVTTNSASSVSAAGATLNGYLNGLGGANPVAVAFDWGTSTGYGNTPGSISPGIYNMSSKGAFSAVLSGLNSSTTYHFRATAAGYFSQLGADQLFTTSAAGPQVYFISIPASFSFSSASGTASGNNTQTMSITYTVGNNGHSTSGDINYQIQNISSSEITVTNVSVARSVSSGGSLSKLTTSTSGGALGTFSYSSGTGGSTISGQTIGANSSSSLNSIHISTPSGSQGTYSITISFTYQ